MWSQRVLHTAGTSTLPAATPARSSASVCRMDSARIEPVVFKPDTCRLPSDDVTRLVDTVIAVDPNAVGVDLLLGRCVVATYGAGPAPLGILVRHLAAVARVGDEKDVARPEPARRVLDHRRDRIGRRLVAKQLAHLEPSALRQGLHVVRVELAGVERTVPPVIMRRIDPVQPEASARAQAVSSWFDALRRASAE